jgi:hypothetical protein
MLKHKPECLFWYSGKKIMLGIGRKTVPYRVGLLPFLGALLGIIRKLVPYIIVLSVFLGLISLALLVKRFFVVTLGNAAPTGWMGQVLLFIAACALIGILLFLVFFWTLRAMFRTFGPKKPMQTDAAQQSFTFDKISGKFYHLTNLKWLEQEMQEDRKTRKRSRRKR